MSECTHDVVAQDMAVNADGMCPLCLVAENKRLKKDLKYIEEWLYRRCPRDLKLASEPSLYDLSLYVQKAQRS